MSYLQKGIIKEMLTKEEIEWLNNYHQTVYEKLSPDLNEEEKVWLQEATTSIQHNIVSTKNIIKSNKSHGFNKISTRIHPRNRRKLFSRR